MGYTKKIVNTDESSGIIIKNLCTDQLREKLSYKLKKAPIIEQPPAVVTPRPFVHPDVNSIPMQEYIDLAKRSPNYGVREYADKGRYEGELINDVRHGYGVYYYPSGNIFIGQWENGLRNGKGIYDYTNGMNLLNINNVIGNKYFGEWKNDQRDGTGTSWFSDGGIFTGDYKDGKRNGKGVYTYPSGNQYAGEW